MVTISSGIKSLDALIESLHIGDNVVWEVDAGTSYEVFIRNFVRQSFENEQKVIYVSFNRSPQSVLNELTGFLSPEHFTLIDCFTSGKGKNDNTFLRFYENPKEIMAVRIDNPKSIEEFSQKLNAIEDSLPPGARYVFDSLTGMQDLWADENDTYRFFTYMCPRLFDLDTVAYWILEKDAHSQKFKANLRHITQVVLDLYKRRDSLYLKALKLAGRQDREAFKPHLYGIENGAVAITSAKREPPIDLGSKLKELRARSGMSQKDLAEKVDLTPSFLSQLENNQISPSLSSFMQICNVLGVNPGELLGSRKLDARSWVMRKETVFSSPAAFEDGVRVYSILSGERLSARIVVFPAGTTLKQHFHYLKSSEFIYVVSGNLSVTFEGAEHSLKPGDSIYLRESFPSQWRNEGGDETQVLAVW
ncbi:MAG: helix-turn-helix domain-containing protein [Nitrospirae bacterium]|nr:helix-turn-helix domain-containing protein [Nitrospirota bacterium]